MNPITVEIFRNYDNGKGTIERLPGTTIQCVSWKEAADLLKQMRSAGIQGANSDCNDVAIVFFRGGKRIGWLTKPVWESFKSGSDLQKGMEKTDTFGYKLVANIL